MGVRHGDAADYAATEVENSFKFCSRWVDGGISVIKSFFWVGRIENCRCIIEAQVK
jgi:hypothetical protein